jgi:uncharacterized membrane protein YccF (DUF307 family)
MKKWLRFLGSFLFLVFIFGGFAELFLLAFDLQWGLVSFTLLLTFSFVIACWEIKYRAGQVSA